MQAFVTPDNFIFSVLEESPRIGGFICFLKTLKNFEAGSEILPLLSKCDLNKNTNLMYDSLPEKELPLVQFNQVRTVVALECFD